MLVGWWEGFGHGLGHTRGLTVPGLDESVIHRGVSRPHYRTF